MVIFGVLTLEEAFSAVDMHTLLLLLGMMIITVYLRTAGFFELTAERILSVARTPFQLLVLVSVSSAVLSALFVNDTICLLFTPILLQVTTRLGVNPVPYLIALATASNIGGAMSVTGNPQNMLVGTASGIPYLEFAAALLPVSAVGIGASIGVLRFLYRDEITSRPFPILPAVPRTAVKRPLLAASLIVSGGVLVCFAAGFPYSLVAVTGAAVLLLAGRESTERILESVDWTLLLFFSGLFIVMHGVEVSGLTGLVIDRARGLADTSAAGRIAGLSLVSAVLSNIVSNVPAVMLLRPLVESLGGDRTSWLALAMSSTLAGNLTLIGSVANLIVAQQARRHAELGFLEYFRAGAIITLITMALGIGILTLQATAAHGAESAGNGRGTAATLLVSPANAPGAAREFTIVLRCDTPAARARGLQGFRKLQRNEAALFVFDRPQPATFWMGSVDHPIDIVFVDQEGAVVRVYRGCEPGSRDVYPSGQQVLWVIETAAGAGIREGDRVSIR